MIYRYSTALDPKLRRASILAVLFLAVLVGAAFLAATRGAQIVGFLIMVGTALLGWKIRAFVKSHLNTWIQTTDDRIICRTPSGENVSIDWDDLTHAGSMFSSSGDRMVYFYSQKTDRFVCVPPSFEHIDDLYDELTECVPLQDVTMEQSESAGDALRRAFSVDDPTTGNEGGQEEDEA